MATSNLDLYRRGRLPGLPESQDKYLQDELRKLEKQAAGQFDRFQLIAKDISGNRAELELERTVRANETEALSSQLAAYTAITDTALGQVNARVTDEITARTTETSSLASSLTNLSSTVGNHTAAIETVKESVDGVKARYGVTINNNGYISGISLLSDGSGGTPTSVFRVQADFFAIRSPGSSTDSLYWDTAGKQLVVRGNVLATSVQSGAVSVNVPAIGGMEFPNIPAGVTGYTASHNMGNIAMSGGVLLANAGLSVYCLVGNPACTTMRFVINANGQQVATASYATSYMVSYLGPGRMCEFTVPITYNGGARSGNQTVNYSVSVSFFNSSGVAVTSGGGTTQSWMRLDHYGYLQELKA